VPLDRRAARERMKNLELNMMAERENAAIVNMLMQIRQQRNISATDAREAADVHSHGA
jgi:hypothetical protein